MTSEERKKAINKFYNALKVMKQYPSIVNNITETIRQHPAVGEAIREYEHVLRDVYHRTGHKTPYKEEGGALWD